MTDHPSLAAPFVPPPPLKPQRVMDPYKLCWCQSGKKWKWCHKDRERQPPAIYGAQIPKMRAEAAAGYCSHPLAGPSECSDKIIRSHTVQRRGGLAAIAEDGHVISSKSGFEDIHKNNGEILPRKVGIHTASTFFGFCNRHDTHLFLPLEAGSVILNSETAFLLSFRALSYEIFQKRFALRVASLTREADKGQPFHIQCEIQQYCYIHEQGLHRGIHDLERWKIGYDAELVERRFDAYRFYGVGFSSVLPVVSCGAFHPEFDFKGKPLQRISRGNAPHEHVTFNMTVLGGRTVALLGWMEGNQGPAAAFAHSFAELPSAEKAEAAVRLAFESIENTYLAPSWWNALPEPARAAAIRRIRTGLGLGGVERRPDCLMPDGLTYAAGVNVLEEISGA